MPVYIPVAVLDLRARQPVQHVYLRHFLHEYRAHRSCHEHLRQAGLHCDGSALSRAVSAGNPAAGQHNLAVYMIENRATVRAAAKKFGISKSTVHKDLSERLAVYNRPLYLQVKRSRKRTLHKPKHRILNSPEGKAALVGSHKSETIGTECRKPEVRSL